MSLKFEIPGTSKRGGQAKTIFELAPIDEEHIVLRIDEVGGYGKIKKGKPRKLTKVEYSEIIENMKLALNSEIDTSLIKEMPVKKIKETGEIVKINLNELSKQIENLK